MTTTTREIDEYVAAVHAALADLPDTEREDLLDDLPQHLADVLADGRGTLTEVLGTPESYAAELRASAGLDAAAHARDWTQSLRAGLARADERIGSALGYDRFGHLVRALAPAWWLVRAYLLVQVCTNAMRHSGTHALLVEARGSRILGVVLLAVAVFASVWLGRRPSANAWQRIALAVIGAALAIYGIVLVHHAADSAVTYVDTGYSDVGTDTSNIENIYPVGPDGTVLNNVRLYDQDGDPVVLGNAVCSDGGGVGDGLDEDPAPAATSAAASSDGAALYPLTCAANQGPFGPSSHAPALPSSVSTSASTSPKPTPSPSATPKASPSGTPRASSSR